MFKFKTFIFMCIILSLSFSIAEAIDCSTIIEDGKYKKKYINNSIYGKFVLAAKLTQLSKDEADEFLAANKLLSIKGIPVGVRHNEGLYNNWINQIKQEIDVEEVLKHSDSIYIAEADEKDLEKCLDCIEIKRGLVCRLRIIDKERVSLIVKWLPYDLMNPKDTQIIPRLLKGARPTAAGRHLKVGRKIKIKHHKEVTFPLRRKKGRPLWITIETKDSRKLARLYLPPISDVPSIPTHLRICYKIDCEVSEEKEAIIKVPGEFVIYANQGDAGQRNVAGIKVDDKGLMQVYIRNNKYGLAKSGWHDKKNNVSCGPCTLSTVILGTATID